MSQSLVPYGNGERLFMAHSVSNSERKFMRGEAVFMSDRIYDGRFTVRDAEGNELHGINKNDVYSSSEKIPGRWGRVKRRLLSIFEGFRASGF